MNTSRLYHIRKEIATAASEFCAVMVMFGEVLIFWEILHAMATGDPVHVWVRSALIAAVCAVIFAASAYIAIRRPWAEKKNRRIGTIDAETICRIMGGTR